MTGVQTCALPIYAFSFTSLTTYPISSVLVKNGGSGIKLQPEVAAYGGYSSDLIIYGANTANTPLLSSLGILAPIQITSGGTGYQNNDTIIFSGGSGQGAYANVSVNATGTIVGVHYVEDTLRRYPLGGMGYRSTNLPSITVQTSGGANASLYVPGILGEGAVLTAVTDNTGEIVTIKIINYGEDYTSTPNVSLKVQDILVSNVSLLNLPQKGDTVIQGANINVATYIATVNSISVLSTDINPELSLWNLRVFNYTSTPNPSKTLNILGNDISMVMKNTSYAANTFYSGSPMYDATGVKTYGDGTAKATAKFLNGLVFGEGQYLDTRGQPSSFSVLQNEIYNNFTYQITVQKEIDKYRDVLLNLLHPTGMKLIGRYALKSNNNMNYTATDALLTGYPLYYYTGTGVYATMQSDFTNKSNNIVNFYNLNGATLSDIIQPDTTIEILTQNGPYVYDTVVAVDDINETVTLSGNTWLSYGNVATVQANVGTNAINIVSYTGAFDVITNGIYVNPDNIFESVNPLTYMVYPGDTIQTDNDTLLVDSVDYTNNVIYTTTNVTAPTESLMSVMRNFVTNEV